MASGPKLFKEKVRKVAIVYRPGTPQASSMAAELAKWFTQRKIKVYSHPAQKLGGKFKSLSSPGDLDLVVVLGGDGTYLEAVRMLEGERVPLLGVNMGSLGFLTVSRSQDLYPLVELALE